MRPQHEMIEIAEHITETKTADLDTSHLEDRYRTSVVSLLREKKAQVPARPASAAPSSKNVINLMAMLKRSLSAEQGASGKTHSYSRRVAAASSDASSPKRSKRVKKGV